MKDYIDELKEQHMKKFGKEVNIIGMFWDDPEGLEEGIEDAIESGVPYDEYKMLNKQDQKLFDEGKLLF